MDIFVAHLLYMRTLSLLLIFFLNVVISFSQTIYSKAFGNPKAKPIIFLHGGPGYNCVNFEVTTAQRLADQGFYVIVYDRRGEGRSTDPKATFTFKETFTDLNGIYKKYKLKKVTIIGHSFGGMVATLFAKTYPKKINSVVLVGAPVSLQESFKTIIKTSRTIYASNKDSISLGYLNMLEKMDTTSMQYASYCFMNAMKNGFYSPKNPTEAAKKLYAELGAHELFKVAKEMTIQAPQGFSSNEKYTTLDLSSDIKGLVAANIQVYGLYGKEDGLYSNQQVMNLQSILGESNLKYLDNCSHNVFVDQQDAFFTSLKSWIK